MFADNDNSTIITPTQFLMDSTTNNDWNFSTATSNYYMNDTMIPSSTSKTTTPPSPTLHTPPKSPKAGERKYLLEKNRQAAYRCRQKKKRWVQDLEEKSDYSEKINKELQAQVSQLRDESIYLRNLLLTHSNCQCDMVQDYLKKTSAQLSQNTCESNLYQSYL